MSRLSALARACALSLVLVAPVVVPAAQAADLALVIGNNNYRHAPKALSARVDAEEVAAALREGGYEVIHGSDLSRSEMRRQLSRFAGRLDDADRVVVFYSGHALRSGGQTYLAPVDQNNRSLIEVIMDGVPLELVLRLAGEGSGRAVVFVDGAQLDGFTPRDFAEPGLAHIEPPEGVLVVSAAAPGRAIARRTTRQSDFARNVIREFLAPGARVSGAVRRLGGPGWVAGDTDSALALVPRGRGTTGGGTGEPSAAQVEARLGLTAMERQSIQRSLSALGFDTRGVDGIFGPGSRAAIRNWQRANDKTATGYLTAEQVVLINRQGSQAGSGTDTGTAGPTAAEIESRLGLSASERSDIQESLTRLGHDTRGTGGVFGSGTRTAIRNWQRANDYEETGYLTAEQVVLINRQRRQGDTGTAAPSAAEVEARLELSASERRSIQRSLTLLGYDTRGTDGIFGSGTRTAIRNWQRANDFEETGYLTGEQVAMIDRQGMQAGTPPSDDTGPAPSEPASAEAALGLSRNDRLSIEQRLAYLGFPPGPQDGFFDADTRWAIEGYQRSRGYAATGYLDQRTVAGLVEETRGVRTGIVTGAEVLFDILRGLGGEQ